MGGEKYEDVLREFEEISTEIQRIEKLIESLEEQLEELDIEITDNKRKQEDFKEARDYAIKRNELERDIKILNSEVNIIDEKIKGLNNELYKTILNETSKNILFQLDKKHSEVMSKYDKKLKLEGKLEVIRSGIKDSICRYCNTILDEKNLKDLKKKEKEILKEIKKVTEVPQPDTSYDAYRQTLKRMDENIINQDIYSTLQKDKYKKLHKNASFKQTLEELKQKYDPKYAEISIELEDIIREQEREKGRIEGLISSSKTDLIGIKEIKSELNQKITSIDETELNILSKRINIMKSLIQLYEDAISIYTEERKKDVEKEATKIFRKLRSKKDFDKLCINDNYGLSIITTSGEILDKSEWRSAGEEQLVAISLIGALNNCSKIEAPISMDTPFGRLDLKHGGRVMSYLPNMSDQIILFATDREIRDEDLSHLKGKLKSDYTLEHLGEKLGSKIKKTR